MKSYRTLDLKKNQALILTAPFPVSFPSSKPLQKSLFSQLKSLLPIGYEKQQQLCKKIIPIPEELVLMLHGNAVRLYQYTIDFDGKLSCRLHSELLLSCNAKSMKVFETGKQLRGKNFFIVVEDETQSLLELLEFRTDENEAVSLKVFKMAAKIYCWSFVSDSQILIWVDTMTLYHYRLSTKGFQIQQTIKTRVNLKNLQLRCSSITGYKDYEQEKMLLLVYVLFDKKDSKIKIHLQQIIYPIEGKLIYNQVDHQVVSFEVKPEMLDQIRLYDRDNSIMIRLESEVLFIKKKFQKYYVIDNIYKKDQNVTFKISQMGMLISCRFEDFLEIREIQISQAKIQAPMIDFLDFKDFKNDELLSVWLIQKERTVYPIFAISDKQNNITLRLGNRIPKLKKIAKLVNSSPKSSIEEFQKIGQVLGINEGDFYFNMWSSSRKNYDDIENYLIKCNNYTKIVDELNEYLKRKELGVGKIAHLFQKLQQITMNRLKTQLTDHTLLEFFSCSFILKKFSLYLSDYRMNNFQFKETIEKSLYSYVHDIINQKFHPRVKKVSLWERVVKDPPQIKLSHIQNVFKLPLLQDYENFLLNIFSQYEDNIPELVKNFPELFPKHPFTSQVEHALLLQENSKGMKKSFHQKQFFAQIFPNEIKRELSFTNNIFQFLFEDYQTSFINKRLAEMHNYSDFKEKKYFNHVVISASMERYIENIKSLSGLKVYILVCEFVARAAVRKKRKPRLAQIFTHFKEFHQLDDESIETLEVHTLFYKLMIKEGIIQASHRLQDLIDNPVDKYIGLFFLGNKQKKNLIFNEFMDIYSNKERFRSALMSYVNSEHCSKIQLSMLIDLIAKKNQKFQIQNQKIIEVIISGFCSRIQLRDIDDANHFRDRIKTIQLEGQLLQKIDKIDKIKVCLRIFDAFFMQDLTFQFLLTKTVTVVDNMMEKFFTRELRTTHVIIQKKNRPKVNHIFEDCQGIFQLLHYLRENIFFNLSGEQLVQTYCKKLVQWQQFQELQHFFYNSDWLTTYDLDRSKSILSLMYSVFTQLYQNQELFFDKDTKSYIRKIMAIDHDPENNVMVIRQEAKLRLVELFEKWNYETRLNNLQIMCNQWHECAEEANREVNLGGLYSRSIMIEIIQGYWEHLDIDSLQEIYYCFMVTSTFERNFDTKKGFQFFNYCTKLAEILMDNNKLKQTAEIIQIVNKRFQCNYELMTQCMLKSMIQLYSDDEKIVKRYIDYFVNNWEYNSDLISMKFGTFFADNMQNHEEQYLHVNPDLCFKNHRHKVQTQALWNFVKTVQNEALMQRQSKNKSSYDSFSSEKMVQYNTFYNYFFLSMGLAHPKIGFSILDYISYNHNSIYSLFKYIDDQSSNVNLFFFLDYSLIASNYLNSLTKLIVSRNQNLRLNDQVSLSAMAETLQNVRDEIKKGRYKYDELSPTIIKMCTVMNQIKRKKNMRANKYNIKIRGTGQIQNQLKRVTHTSTLVLDDFQKKKEIDTGSEVLNRTISFQEFKKIKKRLKEDKDFSMTVGIVDNSERMIVSQIVNNIESLKKDLTMMEIPQIPNHFQSFNEFQVKSLQDKMELIKPKSLRPQEELMEIILSGDYTPLDYWSPEAVFVETMKIYEDQSLEFWKVLKMFYELCVGNNNKIQVLWVAEPEKLQIPNKLLKKIFNLPYLNLDFTASWEEEKEYIFNQISLYIQNFDEASIISLAGYLNDISKIQYKKLSRQESLNTIGKMVLDSIAKNEQCEAQQIFKIYRVVPLLSLEYLDMYEEEIRNSFRAEGLSEALNGSLELTRKQKQKRK